MAAPGARRLAALAALLALGALPGCPSYLVAQSPRTVAPGHVEVSASASNLFHFGGTIAGTPLPAATQEPDVSASARIGLTSFMDLGLHVHAADLGVGADLKIRFLDLPHLQVAVAPGIETSLVWPLAEALSPLIPKDQVILKGFVYTVHLPLLFGLPLEGGHLFFFGPKLLLTNWRASAFLKQGGQTESVGVLSFQPGIVVGAEIATGRGLRLLPEVDVHYDVDSQAVFVALGVTGITGS